MALLNVTMDPDTIGSASIKDIRIGYKRWLALLEAQNVHNEKRIQDEYKAMCGAVKQVHIDSLFFGRSNVHNYKTKFDQFDASVASNRHPDYARMQKWLKGDLDAPAEKEIWGAHYKGGKDKGITDFNAWMKDLGGTVEKVETAALKRSHKKKVPE